MKFPDPLIEPDAGVDAPFFLCYNIMLSYVRGKEEPMLVVKIIFCIMLCVPLAALGLYLFEKLTDSATGEQ